jgi:hypothetical protein
VADNATLRCHHELVTPCEWKEETFDDTKGGSRNHKSKMNRQCNGQKKKDQYASKDLQTTTQKANDWTTRTPQKSGVKSGALEG